MRPGKQKTLYKDVKMYYMRVHDERKRQKYCATVEQKGGDGGWEGTELGDNER